MLDELLKVKQIFDHIQDSIIISNPQEEIVIFNSSAVKLTGIPYKNALGKNINSIIPDLNLCSVIRSGKKILNQRKVLFNKNLIITTFPLANQKGTIFGAVEIINICSDKHSHTTHLNDIDRIVFLEAVINSSLDPMSVVDMNGKFIMFNPAYTKLTGRNTNDLKKSIYDFIDRLDDDSIHHKVLTSKQPCSGFKCEKKLPNKNIIAKAAPIVVNGSMVGSVGILQDISEINRLANELEKARKIIRKLQGSYNFEDIIGRSKETKTVIELAKRVAPSPTTVLLRGESGTGKELFAHAIHNNSSRKEEQFIRVNCAAINENLFESELFGFEEGSFTGAKKGGNIGFFEIAHKGTIFLDEIGEMNIQMQTKLLRVLQEKEIVKIGASKPTKVDVRVIAATNANLEDMIENRKFREDLYYRLNTFPINIPPLRDRKADIPLLALHIVQKHNNEYNRNIQEISPEAVGALLNYDWPGNIRELENIILYAMINMKISDTVLLQDHLPTMLNRQGYAKRQKNQKEEVLGDYKDLYLQWEKELLIMALRKYGNKTEVAKKLNMAIRTLYYKFEKHGIE